MEACDKIRNQTLGAEIELQVLPFYSSMPDEDILREIFSPTPTGKRKVNGNRIQNNLV